MAKRQWQAELARDLVAFGSIPFLVLTIARVSGMSAYYPMQFVISSAVFFVLRAFIKAELRSGIGLILLTFISLYYGTILFFIFASVIYAGIVVSLFYLEWDRSLILKGLLLGAVSTVAGFFIVKAIFF